jgi:hypothetical protein
MEEYTLMNRFTERFRTRGRQRVRLKEGQFLKEENFALNKKELVKGYRLKGASYANAL